jgi:hypothetical protein
LTDRHTSDETGFEEFAQRSVPDALGDVIDQIRNEWDGSPIFVLAIPGHEQLDPFVLPAEAGAARLAQILDALLSFDELPVAAAFASSAPLFTSSGVAPGEGMLSIYCADSDGRETTVFKRLHENEAGEATVGELPGDFEGQMMAGVTTEFINELLTHCGEIHAGEVPADAEKWDDLLDGAVERLERSGPAQ